MKHNLEKYEVCNAVIESTMLGEEDHGMPSCFVHLDYGGIHQVFGGYDLRYHKYFTFKIMRVVGIEKWETLKGTTVRVAKGKGFNGSVKGIGHIIEDKWYFPEDEKEYEATQYRSKP
jgi:hypothetical protein